jgi:hypothetical protein
MTTNSCWIEFAACLPNGTETEIKRRAMISRRIAAADRLSGAVTAATAQARARCFLSESTRRQVAPSTTLRVVPLPRVPQGRIRDGAAAYPPLPP